MNSDLEETILFLQENCDDPEETIRLSRKEVFERIQPNEFMIQERIAEGGMGVIYEGRQTLPDRIVAIKKSKKKTPSNQQQLLQEAMIVGSLEHPNIIPIHQIIIEEEEPAVVMKRIRGESFKDKIKAGCSIQESLQILIPVCNAVEYSHSQQIIHRDIKPSNIMIGHFGEVYLLDWGLAFNLSNGIETEIVGSPSFMAPEMLERDIANISELTDVYLLGSTLHYAITGKARHTGRKIRELVDKIHRSEAFQYDMRIPEDLAVLINSSCSKLPEDRPRGVREFRECLEAIINHWPSLQMTQDALVRTFEVSQISKCDEITTEQIQGCHQIFTLARQDFEYALRIWPDNLSALEGLEQLLIAMIEIHLKEKEYAAALLLHSNLHREYPQLFERITVLKNQEDELQQEKQRLLELGEAHDFVQAHEASAPFAALLALSALIIAVWSNYAYVFAGQPLSLSLLLMSGLAVLIIVAFLILYRKDELLQNKAAIGMYTEVIGTMLMISCNRIVGIQYEIDVNAIMSIDCFIIAFATMSIWSIIIAGEYLSFICFVLGAVSLLSPSYSLTCLSLITMITPTYTWYAWKKGSQKV
jgi:eukaryotic-like serine/threonine-protein kinase